jgi:hypothetical protein
MGSLTGMTAVTETERKSTGYKVRDAVAVAVDYNEEENDNRDAAAAAAAGTGRKSTGDKVNVVHRRDAAAVVVVC